MKRISKIPRNNWKSKVEALGFNFHTFQNEIYWDESAYYAFSMAQIEELEKASQLLYDYCVQAIDFIIEKNRFAEFGIPEFIVPTLIKSWNEDHPSIYGRFDFSYDGIHPPKLLEFNADTPTALLEASVVQWYWLKDCFPQKDQYNSIHETLVQSWKEVKNKETKLHLACASANLEDALTTQYMADAAAQAGWEIQLMDISDIGYQAPFFVDTHGQPIRNLFKLYPWEWMVNEAYGEVLPQTQLNWIEPIWKMLFANKALMVVLYELFPDCPYLLPAAYEPLSGSYVQKPKLSREGANIRIIENNTLILQTFGDYGAEGWIYQAYAPLPNFQGNYPVIGSWMIGGVASGIGIREAKNLITDNAGRFVPHLIL